MDSQRRVSRIDSILQLLGVGVLGWIFGMLVFLPAMSLTTEFDSTPLFRGIGRRSFPFTFSFYMCIFVPSLLFTPYVAPSLRSRWGRIVLGAIIGFLCAVSWTQQPAAHAYLYGGFFPISLSFALMGAFYGWGLSRVAGDDRWAIT